MDLRFYAVEHTAPTLTVNDVTFFGIWAAMKTELARHYSADAEQFDLVETYWGSDDEYAEVVTLDGRIVGALDRALGQRDVAAIWGVDRMEKQAFANRLRSLFMVDGDLLPELTGKQQYEFVSNPVRYFLACDEMQSNAIMREVEKRQQPAVRMLAKQPESERAPQAAAKAPRQKKPKRKIEGQTEMLFPISGGRASGNAVELTSKPKSPQRKAG